MKYKELEDAEELVTEEWLERRLKSFKTELNTERLQQQCKLINIAGLIGFGLIWGFVIAEFLLRK
jgi:hypothetical protein